MVGSELWLGSCGREQGRNNEEGEVNRACSGYNGRLEWYFWRAVGKISFLEEIWWGE